MKKTEAHEAVQIMRDELRQRMGIGFAPLHSGSHAALLRAIEIRLCRRTPSDECRCGALLRLNDVCSDCGKVKRRSSRKP
jgi:hypothetical protein